MNTAIDITEVTLYTKRLILRPWKTDDLDDLFEYASVEGVGEMAGWKAHSSKEESEKILQMFIGEKKTFALEYQNKVIGSLGIEKYDEQRFPEFADIKCREIGFVLAKPYWGRGLMKEAVDETVRWLFEEMDLDQILCGHFLSNRQSERLQEKCGFRHYSFGSFETQMNTVVPDEIRILKREDWLKGMDEV